MISEGRTGLGACDGLFWGSTLSQGIYQTVDQEYPKRAIIQRTLPVSVRAKRSSGRISKNEGLSMKATELVERLCFQGVKQLSRSFRRKAVSSLRCIARE